MNRADVDVMCLALHPLMCSTWCVYDGECVEHFDPNYRLPKGDLTISDHIQYRVQERYRAGAIKILELWQSSKITDPIQFVQSLGDMRR
jgi:hypothetical protein